VRAARALLDDLAALVEAGLVAPVREGTAIRYALVDEIEQCART
jgi:DNA-binding transcriptional ArsR family regulator